MINFLYLITGNIYISVLLGLFVYACFFFDLVYLIIRPKNQLAFIVSTLTAIGGAIGAALGFAAGSAAMITTIGITVAVGSALAGSLVYGGVALALGAMSKKVGFDASSPTYGNPTIQTQTNPDLPVPLLYGTVKLAGNRIWQDDDTSNGIKRIVAFAEGEITSYSDIRLNDIKISEISGINIQYYTGTSYQGLPAGISSETVGSLKNIAYLYINVPKSQDIDINYNLTAIVSGRKIRVYTTPNSYTVKYSENPAWVLFDFLTCYNGRGLCLNDDGTLNDTKVAELFDLNSFIEAAAFCDEIVLTNGKATPRFTFNMIFDSQTSHRTLLDEIYRNCRGVLAVKNGKLQFKIDKAEVTKKVFNAKDIINGSETFQTLPHEEHYDILKIDYVSPEHEWQKVQAFAEIPNYRDGVPIEHEVNCYSITNFQQASRLAWYYINSKTLCPYFGSFQTGFKGADLEVGDVIQIPVLLMGLLDYLVKVTSVIDNGTGVYTVNYRTYNPALYQDTLGSKEPTVLVTLLSDRYAYPDDVIGFNVVQQDNYYNFSWQYTNNTDTYEIRYGNSWETGEVIGKNISLNSFSYKIRSKGLKNFWIKARNQYNYSQNATLDVIYISDIPQTNIVVTYDIIADNTYNFYQTTLYNGKIKLRLFDGSDEDIDGNLEEGNTVDGNDNTDTVDGNNITILWHNINDNWGEGDTYYQNGGVWGANVFTQGEYTSYIYDLEGELDCYISTELNFASADTNAMVQLLWRYSDDNVNWSDWENILSGSQHFRYCQFKLTFNSPQTIQTVCDKAIITVDVPDKFDNIEISVDSTSGKVINYDYLVPPSIVATVNDNISAYAVITNKTEKQATVMVYNNNGTATTGNVSLYLKGY